jgi:hypothetical protein
VFWKIDPPTTIPRQGSFWTLRGDFFEATKVGSRLINFNAFRQTKLSKIAQPAKKDEILAWVAPYI